MSRKKRIFSYPASLFNYAGQADYTRLLDFRLRGNGSYEMAYSEISGIRFRRTSLWWRGFSA